MSSTPHTTATTTAVGTGAVTPAEGSPPQHHHHYHHHTGRRLRRFLHPDGRKIHIAGSPDEAERLRKTLSECEKESEFDLVIHGSDEHVRLDTYNSSESILLHWKWRAELNFIHSLKHSDIHTPTMKADIAE
jgi:hypothetical protein